MRIKLASYARSHVHCPQTSHYPPPPPDGTLPKAFPQDYDAILPLKLDIDVDIRERLIHQGEPVDPDLLRRVLANHTGRAGYLLAVLHRPGGLRYDLDGQPAGEVDALARSEAVRLLGEHQRRQKETATRHRQHRALEKQQQATKAARIAERSDEPPKSSAVARKTSATACETWNGKPPRNAPEKPRNGANAAADGDLSEAASARRKANPAFAGFFRRALGLYVWGLASSAASGAGAGVWVRKGRPRGRRVRVVPAASTLN